MRDFARRTGGGRAALGRCGPRRQPGLGQSADQTEPGNLAKAWTDAAAASTPPAGPEAQALATRQFAWLQQVPGTPGYPSGPTQEYWLALADMYVDDERFASNYGGIEGAAFVRDAMRVFASTRWVE